MAATRAMVALLADHPDLGREVAVMRWLEWGHPPEPEDLAYWLRTTAAEAGRSTLPMTWVAREPGGQALGALGLAEFDLEERRDRSPWLVGMVVRRGQRGRGLGRLLLDALAERARADGQPRVWVATGGPAVKFYRACGYEVAETFTQRSGEATTVLSLQL